MVPSPLNRDERFRFAADLAGIVLGYIGSYAAGPEPGEKEPYPDAPQLIVPNAGRRAVRRAARPLHPVPAHDWRGGRAPGRPCPRPVADLLRRAFPAPGSCLLLPSREPCRATGRPGSRPIEDQNLAALLGLD